MKHVKEIDLIQYAAGRLTASANQEVQGHIAACQQCHDRWLKAVELWNTMGQWDVDTSGHDVSDRITALAEKAGQQQTQDKKTRILLVGFLPVVIRIAASIIIAVGVGHKLGKYSVTATTPKTPASQNRPEYLSALSLQWSSELAWFILEQDSQNVGQQK